MKKNIFKILGICLLILTTLQAMHAQKGGGSLATVTINGPTNSSVGSSENYTITTSPGLVITSANWSVIGGGGSVQSQNNTSATINWTSSGTHSIKYVVTASNYGSLIDNHSVTVVFNLGPLPPPTPNITNVTCTSATLVASGPIPLGDTWYWQGTNASGTSMANPSTSNYNVTSNGTYYIRARDTSGEWSIATPVTVSLPSCQTSVNLSNENYVYTITPQVEITNISQLNTNADAIKNVTYFDGLGRPIQNVAIKQSATQKDIITHIEYDTYGRQTKDFLPYASANNTGAYESIDPLGKIKTYYKINYGDDFVNIPTNNVNPYSEKELEASPLNRVYKQAAPGEDWKLGNGHEIKFEYTSNDANEVRLYRVSLSSNYVPTLTGGASYYAAGELFKIITKDENHTSGNDRTTEEFKNLQGQVILKRTYNNNQKHDTYYVYDDYGNLSFVLPPKAEATINIPNNTELNELCYQYQYDSRNRLVEKKIPGKGWEYIVYDKLDRPILTQDAIQRAKSTKEWLFTKYDKYGRVILTGIYKDNGTRTSVQTSADGSSVVSESFMGTIYIPGTLFYYSNDAFPNNIPYYDVYTINYYDSYVYWDGDINNPSTTNYGETLTTRTQGLTTASKIKVLGVTDKWITTITGYDDKARPVYVSSKNDYLNTTDIAQTEIDFAGKILETTSTHNKTDSGQATITTVDMFTYDHATRLVNQTQKVNNKPIEVIVSNTYNELGQLTSKRVGGLEADADGLQTVDYAYNVRGWLKNINQDANNDNDLFNFTLRYNDPINGTALYNGNISQTSWNTLNTDSSVKTYTFSYDALNRILSGVDNTGNYNLTSVSYDKNGNIINLQRKGHTNALGTTFGIMDNLNYTYDSGNKLIKVSDSGHITYGFKDGANTTTEYNYDANGNMVSDSNKGIGAISYNHLNLPTQVSFPSQLASINYIYDATGVKQRKVVSGYGIATTTTDYAGGYIYENNVLQFFSHAEGYVKNENGTFSYVFQYKDHLGNVRLSYADTNGNGSISQSEIIEESNYYPFGLKHKGYNNIVSANGNSVAQKYKYNGIELEESLGLNLYEMDWRGYDASLGRFMQIDQLTELIKRHSPYNFSFNNPIFFSDPSGMMPEEIDLDEEPKPRRFVNDSRPVLADWYENKNGDLVFDDRVKSQEDLVRLGIDGTYIGASFLAEDQNGVIFMFNSDGTVTKTEATIALLEASGINTSQIAHVTSTMVDDGESQTANFAFGAAGLLLLDDATVVGVLDDVAIPVLVVIGAVATIFVGDAVYEFASHRKRRGSKKKTNDKHTKPRPGRGNTKQRQKPNWKQNPNKKKEIIPIIPFFENNN